MIAGKTKQRSPQRYGHDVLINTLRYSCGILKSQEVLKVQ